MSNNTALAPIDPNVFLTFDRLDDDQIIAEMKGAALQDYVYEFSQGGQTVRGLSKIGTDDAARLMAVKYGEALREIDAWLEKEDNEAGNFKALVKRFIIKEDGTAIEMDSAIGHKRQPKTTATGKPNPFWYEQGGQKALRNAKQKLMPETIKQAIIQSYIQAGKVRKVNRDDLPNTQPIRQQQAQTPRQQQPEYKPAPVHTDPDGLPFAPEPEQSIERKQLIDSIQIAVKILAWPPLFFGKEIAKKFNGKTSTQELTTEELQHLDKAVKAAVDLKATKAPADTTQTGAPLPAEFPA